MKKVIAHRQHCMGCRLCEVACATVHSESGDVVIAHNEEMITPCNTVFSKGDQCLPMSCRHCKDPACVTACIAGALTKDTVGRTLYDQDRCVGCYSCVMVCPFGAIQTRPEAGAKGGIAKCDLCEKRGRPACVDACPNRALTYEER